LDTAFNPRTTVAILFFALAMMTLFNDKIDPLKKRILFIVFIASCVVSHYSTTYIFFFIMLGALVGTKILSKKYAFKKVIGLTTVILFFSMIFFWYSQVTETAFTAGIGFIENTLINLNKFFVEETRGQMEVLFGKSVMQRSIAFKIHWVLTWITLAFIAIGVITLIRRRKEMSFPELNFKKPAFSKKKCEVEFFMIALVCSGLLVVMVVLPYVAKGYATSRLFCQVSVILSIFFVVGGIMTAKYLNQLKRSQQTFKKSLIKNTSRDRAYLIILLILIPYFLCATGVMYNVFGVPHHITLNSEGNEYDRLYVHDQESYAAKWFKKYTETNTRVYTTDLFGRARLMSQAKIPPNRIKELRYFYSGGYIYLRYNDVVNGRLEEFSDTFIGKSMIYDNGGSEIWN